MQISMQPQYSHNLNCKGFIVREIETQALNEAMKACNTKIPNAEVIRYLQEQKQFFAEYSRKFKWASLLPIISGYISSDLLLDTISCAMFGFGIGEAMTYKIKSKICGRVIDKIKQGWNNNDNDISAK